MKKLISILLLLSTSVVVAQTAKSSADDAKTWLTRMNETYASAKSLGMKFRAEYYAVAMQQLPTTSVTGEMHSSGLNYYSDAMGQVVVMNKRYTLIIDKNQKTITCLPGREEEKKNATSGMPSALPDSTWMKAANIKLLDKAGPFRRIEIVTDGDAVYAKTELKINATTYALEEVTYYYKKLEDGSTPKLVVHYSAVSFNDPVNESFFSDKKYIQKKNGQLIAAPAWSSYQVIDLTQGIEP